MKIKNLLLALCYLIAIAVSIKSFREPDLWWQIRTGEWILEHQQVPAQDVFSFTMNGTEWINIKWGFEVVVAFIADQLGAESVFILQAFVNCLLVFFLFRFSTLFFRQRQTDPGKNQHIFLFSLVIAFITILIASEYRMIGRPEMISHLFTVVFIYLLEKNRFSPTKQLYLLIPLQLLWANLHEAFGIGIVILIIYTASSWIEKLQSKEKKTEAVRLSILLIAAAVSIVVNPNGLKLLSRPFNIMSQVYSNKYTTELLDFTTSGWWAKESYIALFITLVSILSILISNRQKKTKSTATTSLITRLNNPYFISIIAFLYLGLTAYRNLIFLSLICFPVFHHSLFVLFKKWFEKTKLFEKFSGIVGIIILVAFYLCIVSNQYYKITSSRDRFGLEVLSINNPVGAAEFILNNNNLREKKCFSDYLTSSYLLWKLQPDFKTYIDLRDLDVFAPEFFSDFLRDVNSPYSFFKLDSVQHFDYAVVFRPRFDQLHSYLFNDSIYALKYADAVAAVYEKTDDFSREDIFSECKPVIPGTFATAVNKLLNPFYTSFDYSGIETDYIAANYYLNVGRIDLAKKRAELLLANKNQSYKGNELLAQLYFRSAMQEPADSLRAGMLATAEETYLQSLREKKDYAPSLLGLGTVHLSQKNYAAAIKDFTKCLDLDADNYEAHLSIAQCYRELMGISSSKKEEYRNSLLKHFLKANSLNPGNPMIQANIGFVYFQMNDCDHATAYLSKVENDKTLGIEDQVAVKTCLRQCGY